MMLDPQQAQLAKRAELFEGLVQHEGWQLFVELCGKQRDRWLQECATRDDRVFLSGMCHATNVLARMPHAVIEQRDNLMASLQQQQEQARSGNGAEGASNAYVIPFLRPPPQTV